MCDAVVRRLGQQALDKLIAITARWQPSVQIATSRLPRTLTVLEDMLAKSPPSLPPEYFASFELLPGLTAQLENVVLDAFLSEPERQLARRSLVTSVEAAARWALLHHGYAPPADLFDSQAALYVLGQKLVQMGVVDMRAVAVNTGVSLPGRVQPRTGPEEVWRVVHSARNQVHHLARVSQLQTDAAALFLLLLVDRRLEDLAKALQTVPDPRRETSGPHSIAVPSSASMALLVGQVTAVPLAREREPTKHFSLPNGFAVMHAVPGSDVLAAAEEALKTASGFVVHGLATGDIGQEDQLRKLAARLGKPIVVLVEPPPHFAPTWPAPGRCGDESIDLGSCPGLSRMPAEYLVETASPTELLRALRGAESELNVAGWPPRTWVSVKATEVATGCLRSAARGPAAAWHRRFERWEDVDVLVIVDGDEQSFSAARRVLQHKGGRRIFARPRLGTQRDNVLRHAAIATDRVDLTPLEPALVSWCDLTLQLAPEAVNNLGYDSPIRDAYQEALNKVPPNGADLKPRILEGEAVQIRALLHQDYGEQLLVWLAEAVPAWLPTFGAVAATVKDGGLAGQLLYLAATAKEPYRTSAIAALVERWTAGPDALVETVNSAADRVDPRLNAGASGHLRLAAAAALVGTNMAADQIQRVVEKLAKSLPQRDKSALNDLAHDRRLEFSNAHADLLERLAGWDPGVGQLDQWLRCDGPVVSAYSQPWWRIVRSGPPDADRLTVLWRNGADASPLGLQLP